LGGSVTATDTSAGHGDRDLEEVVMFSKFWGGKGLLENYRVVYVGAHFELNISYFKGFRRV
jgi:hypothetical protein